MEIALDATLGIEDQVPGAAAGWQVLHHVGDHAAEPANTVFTANGNAAQPAEVVEGGGGNQRLYFAGSRVQLSRRKRAVVLGIPRGIEEAGNHRSRRGCGNIQVRHATIFRNTPGKLLRNPGVETHLNYSLGRYLIRRGAERKESG